MSGLKDHDPKTGPAAANGQGNRVDPDGPYEGVPGGGRFSIKGPTPQQLPCQQPPWGELAAVNVNTGEIAWKVPLGVTDSLPDGKQNTGRPGNGGTIVDSRWTRIRGRDRRCPLPRVRRENGQGTLDGEATRRGGSNANYVSGSRRAANMS